MGVIEQSVIDGWLAGMPSGVSGKPVQPLHGIIEGEVLCPFCGSPADEYRPWDSELREVDGLYRCSPFIEGSCMRVFIPKPQPFPASVTKLMNTCELAVKMVSSRGRTSSVRRAALDALCAVDMDIAEMKRKEQS